VARPHVDSELQRAWSAYSIGGRKITCGRSGASLGRQLYTVLSRMWGPQRRVSRMRRKASETSSFVTVIAIAEYSRAAGEWRVLKSPPTVLSYV